MLPGFSADGTGYSRGTSPPDESQSSHEAVPQAQNVCNGRLLPTRMSQGLREFKCRSENCEKTKQLIPLKDGSSKLCNLPDCWSRFCGDCAANME
jgi:hypothetical protein